MDAAGAEYKTMLKKQSQGCMATWRIHIQVCTVAFIHECAGNERVVPFWSHINQLKKRFCGSNTSLRHGIKQRQLCLLKWFKWINSLLQYSGMGLQLQQYSHSAILMLTYLTLSPLNSRTHVTVCSRLLVWVLVCISGAYFTVYVYAVTLLRVACQLLDSSQHRQNHLLFQEVWQTFAICWWQIRAEVFLCLAKLT